MRPLDYIVALVRAGVPLEMAVQLAARAVEVERGRMRKSTA